MTALVYRIKDLEAHPEGVHVDVDLDQAFMNWALTGSEADPAHSTADLRVRLLYQGGNVLCHGSFTGRLQAQCQRCLGPAEVVVDSPMHLTFAPAGTATPDAELVDPDDVDYAHHNREVVDLSEVVREQLLLSIPITILCREDCRGLCPVCGIDRNTATCSCEPAVSLSPFAALRNLKL